MAEPTPVSDAVRRMMQRCEHPNPSRQLPTPAAEVRLLPEERHVARLAGRDKMQGVPPNFISMAYYPTAGIRVNRSLDRGPVAIQFAQDGRASRDGLNNEIEAWGSTA